MSCCQRMSGAAGLLSDHPLLSKVGYTRVTDRYRLSIGNFVLCRIKSDWELRECRPLICCLLKRVGLQVAESHLHATHSRPVLFSLLRIITPNNKKTKTIFWPTFCFILCVMHVYDLRWMQRHNSLIESSEVWNQTETAVGAGNNHSWIQTTAQCTMCENPQSHQKCWSCWTFHWCSVDWCALCIVTSSLVFLFFFNECFFLGNNDLFSPF